MSEFLSSVQLLNRVQLFATPWMQPTRLLRPWDFPGKSTGVGCYCLLLIVVFLPINIGSNYGDIASLLPDIDFFCSLLFLICHI